MNSKLEKAQELGVHVIETGFLDAVGKGNQDSATFLISSKNIAKWDCPNVKSQHQFVTTGTNCCYFFKIEKRLGIQDKSKGGSKSSGKSGGKLTSLSMLNLNGEVIRLLRERVSRIRSPLSLNKSSRLMTVMSQAHPHRQIRGLHANPETCIYEWVTHVFFLTVQRNRACQIS